LRQEKTQNQGTTQHSKTLIKYHQGGKGVKSWRRGSELVGNGPLTSSCCGWDKRFKWKGDEQKRKRTPPGKHAEGISKNKGPG